MAEEAVLRAERLGRVGGAVDPGDPGERSAAWLLRDVSVSLLAGECVAVVGPSGAGKTVLLRALAGLDPIQEGAILFRGERISGIAMPAYRSRVMYVHQRPALLEGNVEENLRRVFELKVHRAKRYDAAAVEQYLSRVDRGPSFLHRGSSTLSGGEQQLVALLRALQLEPDVLLLDEPTASIDAETVPAVERLIDAWRKGDRARACLWVTHDEEQRRRVADRAIQLRSGRIAEGGCPDEGGSGRRNEGGSDVRHGEGRPTT